MTKIKRKILFFLFIGAFLVITPYVILYASGYQIDWHRPFSPLMVQKTGMTIIYSEPQGADIFLNGKKQKSPGISLLSDKNTIKTPAKIKNLLPGSYDLKVEMAGYWPWERRITVYPGQITHVLDINLFRKELPILVVKSSGDRAFPSPNLKKAIIGDELFDLKNESSETIPTSSERTIWSADNSKVIIGGQILDLKDKDRELRLEKLIGADINDIKWADNNSNELFYEYRDSLNLFDLNRRISSVIAEKEDILDYLPKGDRIFYAVKSGFSAKLKSYSLNNKKVEKEIDLPPSDGYTFLKDGNGLINLYDAKYRILYLIDPDSQINPLLEAINNAKYFQWLGPKKLFFANDSEIWMMDLENDSRRLLLRWSEPLKGILKTKSDNYVFFYTENSLRVLTWDKGDEKLQVTEFLKLEKISYPFLSENENTLYFTGKIGNQEGLYKLNIK